MAGATAEEMSALNVSDWFFNTTAYPQLRVFHDIDITDNGDGTHSEACADCSLAATAAEHTFDKEAADGNIKYSKCKKCGALFDSETGADLTAEDIVVEALGHNLTEVKEIAATTETTGTKAHYACSECDKLFADEKGTTEVKAEELVIAKLVVDDKEDDKTEDNKTETKPEGDKGDESPKTGETVAAVALAVTALVGAAFVLARKARKA